MNPSSYDKLPQVPIYENDLAAFLILKGHLLDAMKKNFKIPKEWIYFFRKDDDIYRHMNYYHIFRKEMRLIRSESKEFDKENKMKYNSSVKNKGGL